MLSGSLLTDMTTRPHRRKSSKLSSWLLAAVLFPVIGHSTPPAYTTFRREQQADYSPDPVSVMRIWMVYVGQGDGILIQLPTKYNYDPDPGDGNSEATERIDIVVDGGSNPESDANRMTDFIKQLYGSDSLVIEHVVITHHDQDHVIGITRLLGQSGITFGTIYHNGLASYRGGKRNFPSNQRPANAVVDFGNNVLKRGMAFVNPSDELESSYLIQKLDDLRLARDKNELQGIYEDLANAVLKKADNNELAAFQRAFASAPFVAEAQSGTTLTDIKFTPLWPLTKLKSYGSKNWGETINGNSVTFRLDYKDFSMVFTGDHNEKSEPEFLSHLIDDHKTELLDCDVFKVPHHGSSHAHKEFFQRDGFSPVLAVASMGNVGFKSKEMVSGAWQHPSTDVVDWLGGPHRVYHTYIQERAFSWGDITTEVKRKSMIEIRHVLIETDGKWFRLVEVPVEDGNLLSPPTVAQTHRGNGTQWIKATKN